MIWLGGRAARDDAKVIAGNIGQDIGENRRRARQPGHASTLETGQVLPHGIHPADVQPGAEKGVGGPGLVFEGEAMQRRGKKGRPSAADEHDDDIPVRRDTERIRHGLRGTDPPFVGYGMSCGKDTGAVDRAIVLVVCYGDASNLAGVTKQVPGPGQHGDGRLAECDDDISAIPARARWRFPPPCVGKGESRVGCRDAGREQAPGKGPQFLQIRRRRDHEPAPGRIAFPADSGSARRFIHGGACSGDRHHRTCWSPRQILSWECFRSSALATCRL